MELNEYQRRAMTTCMPSSENFSYMMLNLVGEVGEFASKIAKDIRKDKACIRHNNICYWEDAQERENKLKSEAGDILWQLSGVCSVLGWPLDDIAKGNLDKLAARKDAGTIDGDGDGIIRNK